MLKRIVFSMLWPMTLFGTAAAAELSEALRELDIAVLSDQPEEDRAGMVSRDIERRRLLAIQRENKAWATLPAPAGSLEKAMPEPWRTFNRTTNA